MSNDMKPFLYNVLCCFVTYCIELTVLATFSCGMSRFECWQNNGPKTMALCFILLLSQRKRTHAKMFILIITNASIVILVISVGILCT